MAAVPMYKANDYIWIVCKKSVYIRQLRKSGPIIAPLKVKMSTAYSIVCSGIELFQYCPVTHEYAKMTVQNAFRIDKFPKYFAMLTASTAAEEETASTMSLRSVGNEEDTSKVEGTQETEDKQEEETVEEKTEETEAPEETVEPAESTETEETEETQETEDKQEEETVEEKKTEEVKQTTTTSGGKKKKKK